jgi:nucleotide-binding universal stress UspA family protein
LSERSAVFQRIVVAYDESQEVGKALQIAIGLATAFGADLKVVTVLEPLPVYFKLAMTKAWAAGRKREKEARYTVLQQQALRRAAVAGLHLDTEMLHGDEVGSIIEYTREHRSDLTILGMRKHTLPTGHTGQDVAKRSPCALLGVR